jgi:hypothetical protein
MAANDAIIPHRLLLQISALLESLPSDATKALKDEFGHELPTVKLMNRRLRFVFMGRTEESSTVQRHTMMRSDSGAAPGVPDEQHEH